MTLGYSRCSSNLCVCDTCNTFVLYLHYAQGLAVYSVPWVDFVYRDVQTCSDVLDSLVAFGDDAHTLSDGLRCDWMITCHHDDLGEGTFVLMSAMNQRGNTFIKPVVTYRTIMKLRFIIT